MSRLHLGRRHFLKLGAAATLSGVASRRATAVGPNSRLRTAHIGVGGMGAADLGSIASHSAVEVAALCDVDQRRLGQASEQHRSARTFADYREMLLALGSSVDAVVVSTPDHTHAPAAMAALQLGKPVYCQKPLTHDVFEARRLREAAQQRSLPTQMGIQVHSSGIYRQAVAMIQGGAIGKVSKVFAWSSKNWGFDGSELPETQAPPATLAWDLWLGTAADRRFVPNVYHPSQWRKLIDFGTGTLGDMGVHIFDTPYAALELTAPSWVKTTCRPPTGVGHPESNLVEYEFPGTRFTTDRLLWTWTDGSQAPPKVAEAFVPPELQLPGQGSLFVGEQGAMLLPHVSEAVLYPTERFADYRRPVVDDANHYHQWVDACFGKGETSASFSYGGPLTEALLLGVVANRFPGKQLQWDADKLRVVNLEAANPLLRRSYREGFAVEGL